MRTSPLPVLRTPPPAAPPPRRRGGRVGLRPWGLALLPLALGGLPRGMRAQPANDTRPGSNAREERVAVGRAPLPFAPGERLRYEVKFSWKRVGDATLELRAGEPIDGRDTFHSVFVLKGGVPFFRVDDRLESWFDTETLASRRFRQQIAEGNYRRTRDYRIRPERAVFQLNDGPEEPSVREPLDEAAFLYAIRAQRLEVGQTLELDRYFKTSGNPVRIRVVRRERIRVPAGEFRTLVIQPTFQTRGLFSQDGRAEVWLSDDDRRLVVQLRSHLAVGSMQLALTQIESSPRDTSAAPPSHVARAPRRR